MVLKILFFCSVFPIIGNAQNQIWKHEDGCLPNSGSVYEVWSGVNSSGNISLLKPISQIPLQPLNSMIRLCWSDIEKDLDHYDFSLLDKAFVNCYKYNQKLSIGAFVITNGASKIGNVVDGGYCSYPNYLHQRMKSSNDADVLYKNANGVLNWEPNFNNLFFIERYIKLLSVFSDYLNSYQSIEKSQICRKDYVRFIEMRFLGWWGEGAYPTALIPSDFANLKKIVDAYAVSFPDIWILAPTNGMRYNSNTALRDFNFYLLRSKNDRGEFGLFRDNWGDNDLLYSTLFYAGNKASDKGDKMYELIKNKWQKAPVIGEPIRLDFTQKYTPYLNLVEQVEYMHPCIIRNSNTSLDKMKGDNLTAEQQKVILEFNRMYSLIGFRYFFVLKDIHPLDRRLELILNWGNIGLTPTYDLWYIVFFIKDDSGKVIWSKHSGLDLRTVYPHPNLKYGYYSFDKIAEFKEFIPHLRGNLYLKVVDPQNISPNMYLSQQGRLIDGSYFLLNIE